MTYHSVAEIFDDLDETRARLERRVALLDQEQQDFRTAPEVWSAAQIVEHLAIMEEHLTKVLQRLLAKAESASASASSGPVTMKPFSMDTQRERSAVEKYQAPEIVQPRGDVMLPDLLARLQRSRAELRNLQPRMEAADLSLHTYPHPAFGPFDGYQWLALIGLHEDRHLRQMERLLSSMESKRAESA